MDVPTSLDDNADADRLGDPEGIQEADSEARDVSQPWLDPMAKETERVLAQDLRGHLRGQKAHEVSLWKQSSFNKTTTYGEITSLSIRRAKEEPTHL
jgi:ATP-dependent RNA helicase DHX8/PRP22